MSKLKITLVRSTIGRQKKQKATVESLGLRKMHHSVIKPDNPQIRGMVEAVRHLVSVEPVEEGEANGTQTA
ncbi:MAG: 50S ribosomal protein L30 [Armatimonadetes bacterium]|nr:50S ribosomal protein L30 [Armatimonadota bacterium]